MFQERQYVPTDDAALEDLPTWQPLEQRIDASAAYVIVDELDDEAVAVLVATLWPRLDSYGRLRFPSERYEFWLPPAQLLRIIEIDRGTNDAEAPSRHLRVGDVFAARMRGNDGIREDPDWTRWLYDGLIHDEPASPLRRVELLDVSAPARDAAKAALYGAVAPTVTEDYALRVGLPVESASRPGEEMA